MSLQNEQVFYFGDSLTDVGVIFGALVEGLTVEIFAGLLAGLGPNPTPDQIAFAQQQATLLAQQQATLQLSGFGPQNAVTNEFTHASYFAEAGGAEVGNFANGGARALGVQEPFGPGTGYDSNLGGQLDRFTASTAGFVEETAKAIVFIGSNDFSDILGDAIADPDASVFDILGAGRLAISSLIAAQDAAARTLDDAGVGTVYLGTLPAISFFPGGDVLDGLSGTLSDGAVSLFNGLLAAKALQLRLEGIDARIIDYAALAEAFTNDPIGFGVIAPRSDFLIDGSTFDSDQVGFWDPIHPAEAIHQAWGAYTNHVLQGGTTSSLSDFGTYNFQNNKANAVFANGGNDKVYTFRGDDIVFGGTGNDRVYAGRDDDIVSGGTGRDYLRGERGDDIVAGGQGNDTAFGDKGDDVLIDGLGNDFMRGGAGDDTFIFVEGVLEGSAAATRDKFHGGSGFDTLYLVLSDPTYDAFVLDGAADTLAALGIETRKTEEIVAINGRDGVESVLGGEDWFQDADFWGLAPAPTVDFLV